LREPEFPKETAGEPGGFFCAAAVESLERRPTPYRIDKEKSSMPHHNTDDVRIRELKELIPPAHLIREFPCTEPIADLIFDTRQSLHRILHGMEDRLIVIIGPCSIHDPKAALEYAGRLVEQRKRFAGELEIVMRVYFEKPRTTVGWKGLINDPHLDNSFKINDGLRTARELLVGINELGLPAGTEFLDMISPQYIADLVSWGAIGARTTESQVHRELASGLSCPVGFKNGTDGSVKIAVDAMKAASQPHHFLSVTKGGHSAIVSTAGNEDCHVILRGGAKPNYDAESVDAACSAIGKAGLAARLMIDASHANSSKKHENQIPVCADIGRQVAGGDERIIGVMVESHLVAGRQDLQEGCALNYGQSITDACIGWDDSVGVLEGLAESVKQRRVARGSGN
jgi:3-deoxy-7-phosphoheptulonate synthase